MKILRLPQKIDASSDESGGEDNVVTNSMDGELLLLLRPITTHPDITCSKLTIETLQQGIKYVQI